MLANKELWTTPRKKDQAAFDRHPDGSFVGFESTPPFEYHNGYLSVHFDTNNYLEKTDLTPLQEEAIWWVYVQVVSLHCVSLHCDTLQVQVSCTLLGVRGGCLLSIVLDVL